MKQVSFFDEGSALINALSDQTPYETIALQDAELTFYPCFIPSDKADAWFQYLLNEIEWRQDSLRMAGREVLIPRLQAWYGDGSPAYSYSGLKLKPKPFSPPLAALKRCIEKETGYLFNSALANLYRNQHDSVSWHADNEPELGVNPVIASLSLGQLRRFKLRHNMDKSNMDKNNMDKSNMDKSKSFSLDLPSGSLLVMKGALQHFWKHQIPKSRREMAPRINLTFRKII